MATEEEQVDTEIEVRRFNIQYPISAYTFPVEVRIHQIRFDDEHLYVDLMDGRKITIPLWWIPTLYNADPGDRARYEINRDRTVILWDPAKCAINDEVRVTDYLGPYDTGKPTR